MNGRLTDVTKDGVATSHYEYDANGNRTVGPGLTASPVYDSQDRLLSYGNCSYTYKADGSLRTKTCPEGTTAYDYDAFGNLRHVALPDGKQIDYLIDAQNRRVGKKVNGVLVEGFVYRNQLQPAVWLNGDGSVRATFVYGGKPNVPEYMVQGGATYRLITDQVGSVRLVQNVSTGAVVERIDYDEFGNVLGDTSAGLQPFGFAGGVRDSDIALTRFGVRDYDQTTSRWTAKDPLRFGGGLTDLYSYVGSDPANRRDPSGLLFGGLINAGECYGEDAAQFWADAYLRDSGLSAGFDAVMGGFASLWTRGTSDATFGTLLAAYSLAEGGLRVEMGNWKEEGEWFFEEGTRGPHFHWGEGPGLQTHHLPWQAGDWVSNFVGLAGRGAAAQDILNLSGLMGGAGLAAFGGSSGNCECHR